GTPPPPPAHLTYPPRPPHPSPHFRTTARAAGRIRASPTRRSSDLGAWVASARIECNPIRAQRGPVEDNGSVGRSREARNLSAEAAQASARSNPKPRVRGSLDASAAHLPDPRAAAARSSATLRAATA